MDMGNCCVDCREVATEEDFFAFARERQRIYLRRHVLDHPKPWTEDPILAAYKFTNVYRELDRTTIWFDENVRSKLEGPALVLGTVVFRWFNRIETGRVLFAGLDSGSSPFDEYLLSGDSSVLRDALHEKIGPGGPFVTGSYIVKTPEGHSKLIGLLLCLDKFYRYSVPEQPGAYSGMWSEVCDQMVATPSLEKAWTWFCQHYFLGHFTSYELVTDLRWTPLLEDAPDKMTWANPGPGATRGLNMIYKRPIGSTPGRAWLIEEMQQLLVMSSLKNGLLWPAEWPPLEMRDIEHTLCEFYKYVKTQRGEGRPRQVLR